MHCGIYQITNKINGDCYIGSSVNIDKRIIDHFADLRKKQHTSRWLQNDFSIFGEENFYGSILELCEENYLLEKEQIWMDKIHPAYNGCMTAVRGYWSQETREAKSKSMLGNKLWIGRKHTAETIERMKTAQSNISEETRKKISETLKGRNLSEETKEKMRKPHKTYKGKDIKSFPEDK